MEHAAHPDHFGRHWLIVLAGVLLIGGFWWQNSHLPARPAPVVLSADTQWFLMLRMPAVTAQYESGIDTMRVRYGEWLDSLSRSGFKPMRLSEVVRRLRSGEGVPERTVVLLFDPGFRRTSQIVGPILAERNWPAVWVTPAQEMDRGHREYVTYHQTRQMAKSGWWDVGLIQKDGTMRLRSQDQEDIVIGTPGRKPWSPTAGGIALNEGTRFDALQRLNVISDWTAQDLLNRVQVEVPVSRPVYLTLGQVQNLPWGVTTDLDSRDEKHFDMITPMHRRGSQIAWFGARHHTDFRLDAQADGLVGEAAFRLRWDQANETGVIVTISNSEVHIKSKADDRTLTVAQITRSGAGPRRPLKLSLELKGRTLSVSVDGRPARTIDLPEKTPVRAGLFQIYLYDALKGSARLDSMKLLFTPLQ